MLRYRCIGTGGDGAPAAYAAAYKLAGGGSQEEGYGCVAKVALKLLDELVAESARGGESGWAATLGGVLGGKKQLGGEAVVKRRAARHVKQFVLNNDVFTAANWKADGGGPTKAKRAEALRCIVVAVRKIRGDGDTGSAVELVGTAAKRLKLVAECEDVLVRGAAATESTFQQLADMADALGSDDGEVEENE